MSSNSSIHHIVVDTERESVFTPNQLNADAGDTILIIPVSVRDRVAQTSIDRPCGAGDSTNAVNISRLMFPYLIVTVHPA